MNKILNLVLIGMIFLTGFNMGKLKGIDLGKELKKDDLENHLKELYKSPTYLEERSLDMVCWVRALKTLELIQKHPKFIAARMIFGKYKYGDINPPNKHTWIQYTLKTKDGFHIFNYDPVRDYLIEGKTVKSLEVADGWRSINKGYITYRYVPEKENR